MGATASIVDQQRLFCELKIHVDATTGSQSPENPGEELENEGEENGSDDGKRLGELNKDQLMYEKANNTYRTWYKDVKLKENVDFCELVDFEEALEAAFKTGKTPLLLDSSPDDKVCTFFSYQPDVVILDAKSMVMASKATKSAKKGIGPATVDVDAILGVMDAARKTLVNAMKFGKLLVIRLGTSAPDFVHTFSDDAMRIDTSRVSSAYFPLLVFQQAGSLLHDTKIDFGESRKVSTKQPSSSGASAAQQENIIAIASTNPSAADIIDSAQVKTTAVASWAERLFREEDMRPHKNFALCRDTFRVCVVSQLPLEDIDEFLFGIETGTNDNDSQPFDAKGSSMEASYTGSLPSKELFKIISIVPDAVAATEERLEDPASSDSEREVNGVPRSSPGKTDAGGHLPSTVPTSSAQSTTASRAMYSPIDESPKRVYTEEDMLNRYIRKLAGYVGSLEEAKRTIELVNSLELTKKHDEADAVLMPIIHSGMSQKGTRSLFHIGGGRYTRLRDGRLKKESTQPRNGQQITPEMLSYAKTNAETWSFDDTATCIHRSKNRYVKIGVTWKELWEKYVEQCTTDGVRAMAYKTWMQYRHDLFPLIIVTSRKKEEECAECKLETGSVTG